MSDQLANQIEECRVELYNIVNQSGDLQKEKVLEKSKELDRLIVKYQYMKGGKVMEKKENNGAVAAQAKIMAKLYYYMANEIVEEVGKEEGMEIVRKAIWKFGANRGTEIRKKVEKDNQELNLENMTKYYDMPLNDAWDAEVKVTPNSFKEIVDYCPFAEIWIEFGAEELGYIYCEQDIALMKAFNENIDFSRSENVMDEEEAKCKFDVKL